MLELQLDLKLYFFPNNCSNHKGQVKAGLNISTTKLRL